MKFLVKDPDSEVLKEELVYHKGDNSRLRAMLLAEQKGFCAYTEKRIQELDAVEVEHLDASIKYSDDYYNYYTVIRKANLYKKDEQYKGASFLDNKFFQKPGGFDERIQFIEGQYEEKDLDDTEAVEFIDFLGLNHHTLATDRTNHLKRLRNLFDIASYSEEDIIDYFKEHKEELSYVSAIEVTLDMDLSQFYS